MSDMLFVLESRQQKISADEREREVLLYIYNSNLDLLN